MCKKWMNADKLYKNAGRIVYICSVDTIKRMRAIEKQLKRQKAMWNKLKEYVSFTQPKNINDEFFNGALCAYSYIKDKMQKLEEEDVKD